MDKNRQVINKIQIFALAALGKGISGGDRIFIELARRWQRGAKVVIYVNEEGRQLCQRQNLIPSGDLSYVIWQTGLWKKLGFVGTYFGRIINSVINSLKLKIVEGRTTIVYSASEFWMDSLPCLILKIRFPKVRWVASWYQTAPNPLKGFTEKTRKEKYRTSAFLYWLMQLPVKPLIKLSADFVIVNNEGERKQFPRLDKQGRVVVLIGAVPLKDIQNFLSTNYKLLATKKYDAVFQGRFHPQKGVVELIDIWKKVVEKKPDAKLAMIGDGPLMGEVKKRITMNKLIKNIVLFGYVFDGPKKYRIFSQSKLVVHPAFFDSGGMASAEAMAFGIPCVGFDLESYKSYYPKGMLKVKVGDLNPFAKGIIKLLDNDQKRNELGRNAYEMIKSNWSWDKRAKEVFNIVK